MQGWQEPQLPALAAEREGALSALPASGEEESIWEVWSRRVDGASPGTPVRRTRALLRLPRRARPQRGSGRSRRSPGHSLPSRRASPPPRPSPARTHRVLPVLPVVGVGTQRGRHIGSPEAAPASDSGDRPPQSRQAPGGRAGGRRATSNLRAQGGRGAGPRVSARRSAALPPGWLPGCPAARRASWLPTNEKGRIGDRRPGLGSPRG